MNNLIQYSIKKMFNNLDKPSLINDLIKLVELKSINISDLSFISTYNNSVLDIRAFLLILLFIGYNLGHTAIDINKIDNLINQQNKNIKDSILSLQTAVKLQDDLDKLILTIIGNDDKFFILKDNLLGFKKCFLAEKAIYNRVINKDLTVEDINIKNDIQPLKIFNEILDKCGVIILTGGPGTGKSTWIANWVKDLLISKKDSYIGLRLTATTSKATQRLYEQVSSFVGSKYNIEYSTVHSLLNKDKKWSFFPEQKPYLQLEYLVIDEISMLDSELMYEIITRMPVDLKLILIGDGDQLPSVENGGFLQSIYNKVLNKVDPIEFNYGFSLYLSRNYPVIWNLEKTYRFLTDASVGRLSKAVNNGNYASVKRILDKSDESLVFIENEQDFFNTIRDLYYEYFCAIKGSYSKYDIKTLLNLLNKVRVLTYSKYGKYGTREINRFLLKTKYSYCSENPILLGVPIIILQNIPEFSILNGDIGIVNKYEGGIYYITFYKGDDEALVIDLNKLDSYKTSIAWVITVHKSQGLEFENVIICLKDEQYNLSRSWLYTAITRTKSRVYLYSDYNYLIKIIKNNNTITNFFHIF